MRKHKKSDVEDAREMENWEQACRQCDLTWTSFGWEHCSRRKTRSAVTSHQKPIAEKQDYNKIYLLNLLLNCFHMGMSSEFCFFWLPIGVELNNNQMPQTSRVIPGETKKRFVFRTPGLLQFSGLLWSHFLGCAPVLLKVWNWTPLFIYSILRVIYCFPCVYLSKYGLSLGISDLILEMWYF